MKASVHNLAGQRVDEVSLSEAVFSIEPNREVMHQALVRQLANARQGTQSTQTRAEVSRTGAKVWRQKGTGRARQGSRRGPHWVGGGVAFAPKPRSYRQRMPRKMRRLAIRSVLSVKAQANQLIVIDELAWAAPKTKRAAELLNSLNVESAVLLTTNENLNVKRSFANLAQVKTLHWRYINVRDLLSRDHLIMSLSVLRQIEVLWG